jgi:hypothetical protein
MRRSAKDAGAADPRTLGETADAAPRMLVTMERAQLQELYDRCDPYEVLAADDVDRYVDLDDVVEGPGARDPEDLRPRRYAWINRIAKKFELSRTPLHLLLTGLPGSGKSTELRRVVARLARADGARLYPVWIDAEQVLDLDQPIDVADLVLTVLAETERAVLDLEGKHNDSQKLAHESRIERLWHFVFNTKVESDQGKLEFPGVTSLGVKLKTDPSMRERVRAAVAARTTEFLFEARGHMKQLETRVRKYEVPGQLEHNYAGVIVLFDSIEKLRGFTHNHVAVLDSAEVVMSKGAQQINLGVHALYTVPIAVARRIEGVQLMPLVKISERHSKGPFAAGIEAMRRIVHKRVPSDALEQIFGAEHERRVTMLIERSGGYPRELVMLLREALEEDSFPLTDAAFRRLLANRADEYKRKIPSTEALELLARIGRERGPLIGPEEHRDLVESLLTRSLVFVYQNDEEWADINPALASLTGSNG